MRTQEIDTNYKRSVASRLVPQVLQDFLLNRKTSLFVPEL